MKVLRLVGAQQVRLQDEPVPVPGPGEVLIRVGAVGICGSDLHWFAEAGIGDARLQQPLVLGHEFAGTIVSGPRQRERVAVDPAMPCGHCEFCLEGNPNLCLGVRFAGHDKQDGAMREYLAWPEQNLHSLPDALSFEDGAMLEPLGVALHAVNLAGLKAGMSVGIFGCGPIGLLILQLARASGADQILTSEVLPHRMEAARLMGAGLVWDASAGNEGAEMLAATHGRGVDVAFEAAGVNAAVDSAVTAVKPGGKVILAGIPAEDRTSFSASTARRKGLTFMLVRRMKHTYPRSIRLVEKGIVDVRSLVTHCFSLEEGSKAFGLALERQGLKIMFKLGAESKSK